MCLILGVYQTYIFGIGEMIIHISLQKHQELLNQSSELVDLAKQHQHNATVLKIKTIMAQNTILGLGKVIERNAQDAWWSIFEGWSPKAKGILDILIHPILILLGIVFLLCVWQICLCIYLRRITQRTMYLAVHR